MRFETPNLRHLRAFLEVANHQKIAAASEYVHLSQPAITQAIAKLEKALGVSLFDRRPNGMFPTEVGQLFQARVARVFEYLRFGAKEAVRLGTRRGSRGGANFDHLLTMVQLRALTAMSNFGNFSLAARNLRISQPSVHRAARDLERLSGVTLFRKSSQGIDLTRSAQALAQQVKLSFSELEQGHVEIQEWLGRDVGWIRAGTLPLARTFVLPTAINTMSAERPEVQISIVDGPYDDLLHGLRHGELDMLIGALRYPAPTDDVVQEALFEAPLAVVSRSFHPLARQQKITVDELAAYPWAVPRAGAPTRAVFETLFENADQKPAKIIESSSLVLIRALLLDSDRLTLISAHQILHEEKLGVLKRLPVKVPGTRRDIGVTVRKGWRPTASQARFMDLLRDAAASI